MAEGYARDPLSPLRGHLPRYANHATFARAFGRSQTHRRFSVDLVARLASGSVDVKQASNAFIHANSNHISAIDIVVTPNGSLQGAALTEAARERWARLESDVQERWLIRADALLSGDVDPSDPTDEPSSAEPASKEPRARGTPCVVKAISRTAILECLVREIHQTPHVRCWRGEPIADDIRNPANGWDQRLLRYFWPNPTVDYHTTMMRTASLRARGETLAGAIHQGEALPAVIDPVGWANEIFAWGGVPQRNVTIDAVVRVVRAGLNANAAAAAPMNSGWTKVAAFATGHLEHVPDGLPMAIWDSRVATALIWLLDQILYSLGVSRPAEFFRGIGTVAGRGGTRPRPLQLSWPIGYRRWDTQVAGSLLIRDIRDILNNGGYPRMPMAGAANGAGVPWTTRGVEMVLFMEGY